MNPLYIENYISNSLRNHPQIDAKDRTTFKAYEDSTVIPLNLKNALDLSRMQFIHTPKGVKNDMLDKKILVDLLDFAFNNPVPCNIMAIPGDASFSLVLRCLRYRGFTWPRSVNDDDLMWVKPGDVIGLKHNILSLLQSCDGYISVDSVANEYRRRFGKPLVSSDFQCRNIGSLLVDMGDKVEVTQVGKEKLVHDKIAWENLQAAKFKRSLSDHHNSLGASTLKEIFEKIPDVALLIEDHKTNEKLVMTARVIEERREYLKHDVIKLLKKYSGEMVFSGFEYCSKHEFKGEVNY
ncbi:endonuclease [Tanacetum coccineum]